MRPNLTKHLGSVWQKKEIDKRILINDDLKATNEQCFRFEIVFVCFVKVSHFALDVFCKFLRVNLLVE